MYGLIRPYLFSMDPEKAHKFTTNMLGTALKLPIIGNSLRNLGSFQHPMLERHLFGLRFRNPVGLAAGFDKNGELLSEMEQLGFGFLEIGTVTPRPQDGNPKPRVFRLPKDKALINRMGFNNHGAFDIKERLRKRPKGIVIGGNIGKNKNTLNEDAIRDYLICYKELYEFVDYFVVNVSSPNTPNLRDLQEREPLSKLLGALQKANRMKVKPKPLLLKISPDLPDYMLDDVLDTVMEHKLDGVIATNTTLSREGLHTSAKELEQIGDGGLSGKPLYERSTEMVKTIKSRYPKLPVIAVGGIDSAEDALDKLRAGADLIQIYTGFVYQGPRLIKEINQAIVRAQV
jgi:dihydroorotate dehydrogenase